MIEIPQTADALIDELDRTYPHRCPHPSQTEREIWMQAGARKVVDDLRASQWAEERRQAKDNGGTAHVRST